MTDEPTVHLPQYTPPNPKGLPVADHGQQKPLVKLMMRMLRPKPRIKTPRQQHRKRWKKEKRYY